MTNNMNWIVSTALIFYFLQLRIYFSDKLNSFLSTYPSGKMTEWCTFPRMCYIYLYCLPFMKYFHILYKINVISFCAVTSTANRRVYCCFPYLPLSFFRLFYYRQCLFLICNCTIWYIFLIGSVTLNEFYLLWDNKHIGVKFWKFLKNKLRSWLIVDRCFWIL